MTLFYFTLFLYIILHLEVSFQCGDSQNYNEHLEGSDRLEIDMDPSHYNIEHGNRFLGDIGLTVKGRAQLRGNHETDFSSQESSREKLEEKKEINLLGGLSAGIQSTLNMGSNDGAKQHGVLDRLRSGAKLIKEKFIEGAHTIGKTVEHLKGSLSQEGNTASQQKLIFDHEMEASDQLEKDRKEYSSQHYQSESSHSAESMTHNIKKKELKEASMEQTNNDMHDNLNYAHHEGIQNSQLNINNKESSSSQNFQRQQSNIQSGIQSTLQSSMIQGNSQDDNHSEGLSHHFEFSVREPNKVMEDINAANMPSNNEEPGTEFDDVKSGFIQKAKKITDDVSNVGANLKKLEGFVDQSSGKEKTKIISNLHGNGEINNGEGEGSFSFQKTESFEKIERGKASDSKQLSERDKIVSKDIVGIGLSGNNKFDYSSRNEKENVNKSVTNIVSANQHEVSKVQNSDRIKTSNLYEKDDQVHLHGRNVQKELHNENSYSSLGETASAKEEERNSENEQNISSYGFHDKVQSSTDENRLKNIGQYGVSSGSGNFGQKIKNTGLGNVGQSVDNTGFGNLGQSIQNQGSKNTGQTIYNTGIKNLGQGIENSGSGNLGQINKNTGLENVGQEITNQGTEQHQMSNRFTQNRDKNTISSIEQSLINAKGKYEQIVSNLNKKEQAARNIGHEQFEMKSQNTDLRTSAQKMNTGRGNTGQKIANSGSGNTGQVIENTGIRNKGQTISNTGSDNLGHEIANVGGGNTGQMVQNTGIKNTGEVVENQGNMNVGQMEMNKGFNNLGQEVVNTGLENTASIVTNLGQKNKGQLVENVGTSSTGNRVKNTGTSNSGLEVANQGSDNTGQFISNTGIKNSGASLENYGMVNNRNGFENRVPGLQLNEKGRQGEGKTLERGSMDTISENVRIDNTKIEKESTDSRYNSKVIQDYRINVAEKSRNNIGVADARQASAKQASEREMKHTIESENTEETSIAKSRNQKLENVLPTITRNSNALTAKQVGNSENLRQVQETINSGQSYKSESSKTSNIIQKDSAFRTSASKNKEKAVQSQYDDIVVMDKSISAKKIEEKLSSSSLETNVQSNVGQAVINKGMGNIGQLAENSGVGNVGQESATGGEGNSRQVVGNSLDSNVMNLFFRRGADMTDYEVGNTTLFANNGSYKTQELVKENINMRKLNNLKSQDQDVKPFSYNGTETMYVPTVNGFNVHQTISNTGNNNIGQIVSSPHCTETGIRSENSKEENTGQKGMIKEQEMESKDILQDANCKNYEGKDKRQVEHISEAEYVRLSQQLNSNSQEPRTSELESKRKQSTTAECVDNDGNNNIKEQMNQNTNTYSINTMPKYNSQSVTKKLPDIIESLKKEKENRNPMTKEENEPTGVYPNGFKSSIGKEKLEPTVLTHPDLTVSSVRQSIRSRSRKATEGLNERFRKYQKLVTAPLSQRKAIFNNVKNEKKDSSRKKQRWKCCNGSKFGNSNQVYSRHQQYKEGNRYVKNLMGERFSFRPFESSSLDPSLGSKSNEEVSRQDNAYRNRDEVSDYYDEEDEDEDLPLSSSFRLFHSYYMPYLQDRLLYESE